MNYEINKIYQGDALKVLRTWPDEFVDCIVTSPPYWSLRNYLPDNSANKSEEIGLEPKFENYISRMTKIFDEIKRILKPTGTCFVNLGDTYFGGGRNGGGKYSMNCKRKYKQDTVKGSYNVFDWSENDYRSKCLVMIDQGWLLRNKIIWLQYEAKK